LDAAGGSPFHLRAGSCKLRVTVTESQYPDSSVFPRMDYIRFVPQ
jgi:hypothetical protein